MAYDDLALDVAAGVATITINRPHKRNAMTVAMWSAFEQVCQELASRADVSALVVRGSGGSFCAGADISALSEDDAKVKRVVRQAERALRELPVPTVAAIEGPCFGGGVQVAVACDMRIATTDATFGVPPARLGVVYPVTSVRAMVAVVGPSVAKRLLFTAVPLGATEALAVGLVDRVVEPAGLDAAVAELLGSFAGRSLLTQASSKALINAISSGGDPEAEYARWEAVWAASPDSVEGPAAFLAKRPAEFRWHPSELGR